MLGPMGGFGGMGGFDPGDAMEQQLPPFMAQFEQNCERIALGLINARVRTRALIELLEEKGVFGLGEFDQQATTVWERDYQALSEELTASLSGQSPEAETEEQGDATPQPPPSTMEDYYTVMINGMVDNAVAARVRLRSIIELLEEHGVFAPGEFEQKADAIWERDYEEMVMEYHRGSY